MATDTFLPSALYAAALLVTATMLPRYALELIAMAAIHWTVLRARSLLSIPSSV